VRWPHRQAYSVATERGSAGRGRDRNPPDQAEPRGRTRREPAGAQGRGDAGRVGAAHACAPQALEANRTRGPGQIRLVAPVAALPRG
jgi:hypothetical protein